MPRSRSAGFEVSSLVSAPPQQVWDRVITPAGINHEMRPWLRMTLPRGIERLDPASVELGKPIGRSWVLLFGVLPFDYDDITLVELEPGRRFLERSRMLSQRRWQHERIVEPAERGTRSEGGTPSEDGAPEQAACRVTDRVSFEPRLGLPGAALRPIISAFFRHRHRRLRRWFERASAFP